MELQKILLVDDEADIRLVARMALEGFGGFAVEECSSGHEALERASEVDPQLILLDHMMPELDGAGTLESLRASWGERLPPVVFLTGKTDASEHERFLAAGAFAVIVKPFDPLTLAEQVRQIWQRHQVQ